METTETPIIPVHRWTHTGDRVRVVRGEIVELLRASRERTDA